MLESSHPVRIFAVSGLLTLMIAAFVVLQNGWTGVGIFAVLVVLEVTFSFDNAVVNSRVLRHLSHFWQTMFLTVGIFVAVFLIRFLLPIVLVAIAGQQKFMSVVDMALTQPDRYGELLELATPIISAFGGLFLLMVALHYFIDLDKRINWLGFIERPLIALARFKWAASLIGILTLVLIMITAEQGDRLSVAVAGLLGVLLYSLLYLAGSFASRRSGTNAEISSGGVGPLIGRAAAVSFLYLEVLDASFSLDGVVGAFAVTSNVILIMAGLGIGAVWVRSMTIYMLRADTLVKYRYLEHGAHWAIMALGVVMLARLYGLDAPELVTGGIGLVFIVAALTASQRYRKRTLKPAA